MPTMNSGISDDTGALEEARISAQVLAAITAAAAVFMGKRLRICAIEQLHSSGTPVSRWSRQGRVLVQSSHDLAVKHPSKSR